jgi:hypothetical protein
MLIYPSDSTPDSLPIHSRHVLGELIQVADDASAGTTQART